MGRGRGSSWLGAEGGETVAEGSEGRRETIDHLGGDLLGQLQLAELAAAGQLHTTLEHKQGTLEVVEALSPADVCGGHP